MEFQDVFGSSSAMQLVDVLSDDRNAASLFAQSLLAPRNGQVGGVWVFGEHDLTAVVVKLPNTGGISGEGLWCGESLEKQGNCDFN